ncbi:ABC transporter permease [Archangium sp.]|jgi:ABC-type lipoprotein release transport system permease subunit|uniref:ABC transporter permease n=1 Tax=Archangium sp. TaxID=1872627 RepID=UPI002EDBA3A8
MLHLLLIAWRNLLQHRRRTLLLGSTLAGISVLMVLLLALTGGARERLLESATLTSSGHVNISGFYKVMPGQAMGAVTRYPRLLEVVRDEVPELERVNVRGRGWVLFVSDSHTLKTDVIGVDLEAERDLRRVVQIVEGNLDELSRPGTALLFEEQARKLQVKVGDVLTASATTFRGVNNTADVRVVAIARDMSMLSSFSVFMPNATVRELYQLNDDTAGVLQLYLKDMKDMAAVQGRLRKRLEQEGYRMMPTSEGLYWMKLQSITQQDWTGQKLEITNWEDEMSGLHFAVSMMDALGGVLVGLLLLIVGVGVMNTLWVAIRERTQEVGTLRAIGMHRWRVVAMFVLEGFVLALASTLVGVVLGLGLCAALNAAQVPVPQGARMLLMSNAFYFQVGPRALVPPLLFVISCVTFVSLFPAFLAARLRPITAMSHLG